jgi:Flp pilus assembly protein TadD
MKNVAICLAKLGERDEARRVAAAALEAGPASADAHYGAAVVHALTGDASGALALLEKAFKLGASANVARDDDDLASLRANPGFRTLLERAAPAPAKEVTRAS